jgi:hypothetical protein
MGGSLCLVLEKIRKANGEVFDPLTKVVEMRSRPTRRAADVWDSARFSSIFLASSFFYISCLVHTDPHSANANR